MLYSFSVTFKQLDDNGVQYTKGLWRKREEEQLQNNVRKFCEAHKTTVLEMFNVKKFTTAAGDQWKELSYKIYRTVGQVRKKFFLMYSQKHPEYKKPYSEAETIALIKHVGKFGKDWDKISKLMGRSKVSLLQRYSKTHKSVLPINEKEGEYQTIYNTSGRRKFTPEEDKRLTKVVHDMAMDKDGAIDPKRIDWNSVAAIMGNRLASAFYTRWYTRLSDKGVSKKGLTSQENNALYKKVVDILVADKIKDRADIDWEDVVKRCKHSINKKLLRQRFNGFVLSHKKRLQSSSFLENMIWLKRNFGRLK